jgi:hypothetical protein
MRIKRSVYVLLAAVLPCIGMAVPLAAGPVTYYFQGADFDNADFIDGDPPPGILSDRVTAWITFAIPLGDNFIDADESSSVISWSISDNTYNGIPIDSGPYGTLSALNVETDSSGDVTEANMIASEVPAGDNGLISQIGIGGSYTFASESYFDPPEEDFEIWDASGSDSSPAWTEGESTPEPSTTVLASLGTAILLMMMGRIGRKPGKPQGRKASWAGLTTPLTGYRAQPRL